MEDRRLSFSVYDEVLAGIQAIACPQCAQDMVIGFDPGNVTFVLKDGPSGGWASKGLKENTYRRARREVMGKRQKDHVFTSHLQPNYKGEETGTWREAQEQARQDIGDNAAASYNPLIQSEK